MSQFEYDPEDAPLNELCVATQDPDYDIEADDACYDVVLKDDTASDPFKMLDDALVHVRNANNDFNEALCSMLAHHAFLDHLRNCFANLDEDMVEFEVLRAAAKSKTSFHKYCLRRVPKSIDKTVGTFK